MCKCVCQQLPTLLRGAPTQIAVIVYDKGLCIIVEVSILDYTHVHIMYKCMYASKKSCYTVENNTVEIKHHLDGTAFLTKRSSDGVTVLADAFPVIAFFWV